MKTEKQIGFDLLPQDVFLAPDSFGARIDTGRLIVNTQKYRILTIRPLHSLVLIRNAGTEPLAPAEAPVTREIPLPPLWLRSQCRSADYPAFTVKASVALPDHAEKKFPDFSGFFRYESSFTCRETDRLFMEITDAGEAAG